jgi:hypothetical protein
LPRVFLMTRYLTSYRFFILSKVGLGLAYLWICWDFFRINQALGRGLRELLPDLASETVCNNALLNRSIIDALSLLSRPVAIWSFFILSPVAVAFYVWGRFRWLQIAIGGWVWLSMAGMTARATVLMSTADFWLSWCFILYVVAGMITPAGQWNVSHPVFSPTTWRKNPTIYSEYAGLIVVLEFTVYFYAGINKLAQGWTAWTSGVAIQNLSTDLSVHDFVRGIHVPFFISLVLCYITLFQRLVVPFGFFVMRYRGWAVLILGAMHVGYDLLMQVAIFPLIGVSGLLLIIPPRERALPLFSRPSLKRGKLLKKYFQALPQTRPRLPQIILASGMLALLLIEPAINACAGSHNPYWNIKLMTQAHWIMFADGGNLSRWRFRIAAKIHDPVTGRVQYREIDDLPLRYFPGTWRTRFYEQAILLRASQASQPSGPVSTNDDYLNAYINTAVKLYQEESPPQPSIEQATLVIDPYNENSFGP